MKILSILALLVCVSPSTASAIDIFNLNVFDQLQGEWKADFRDHRMSLVSTFIAHRSPSIVVFEEARGKLSGAEGGGDDSSDALALAPYKFRKYVHEMTGKDGASYGYWIGSKAKPKKWIDDGFAFPGGVERKVIGAVWDKALRNGKCLGVIGLHLSYQNSEVRQKEAAWLLAWLKSHEQDCKQWLVVGDFNADSKDKEIQLLFDGGLKSLYKEVKPTVGAFNPIRRIYGENIPSLTIDWAMGWNLGGEAQVVLDGPVTAPAPNAGTGLEDWVSDHAGVYVRLR